MYYAIVDQSGDFFCSQGESGWFQSECIGWAICSPDRQFVENQISQFNLQNVEIVPMRMNDDFTFEKQ